MPAAIAVEYLRDHSGAFEMSRLRSCRDRRDDAESAGRHELEPPRIALVRFAIERLLDRTIPRGCGQGPLCVVTPGGSSSLLADLAERARAEDRPCLATDGASLGHDMDAATERDRWDRLRSRFCQPQLVIVHRFEEIGGTDRQAAFRQLFDAADAADWCLGLSSHPQAGLLEDDLAARLAAGLVVTLSGDAIGSADGEPQDGIGPSPTISPSISRIISVTARQFGIPTATLTGSGRSRTVARARSLAMLLARRLTNLSYEAIGKRIGGRDHTTAMHATRVTADRLAADDSFAADAEAILAQLAAPTSRRAGSGRQAKQRTSRRTGRRAAAARAG